jgi:hypothetical protein
MEHGSEDPADLEQTTRVMTIMLGGPIEPHRALG